MFSWIRSGQFSVANYLDYFFELTIILIFSFTIIFGIILYMTANTPLVGRGRSSHYYYYFFKTKSVTELISKPYCENAQPEFQLKLIALVYINYIYYERS